MDPQQEETQTEDSNTLTDEQLEYLAWCDRNGYFI